MGFSCLGVSRYMRVSVNGTGACYDGYSLFGFIVLELRYMRSVFVFLLS